MSAEQNKQLTERIIEELFNRGNTATAGDFIHSLLSVGSTTI